ncbi:ABC transporter substrate-binding protein [Hufsiella ginkgonis]|uniref:ABC transporter substrate-binding protein n=1 Tax=Hufsiella ginkgonis TaxID=2695274 RepID=A0A7K1Y3H6_9SPHI|nr:ABC transporter substrate-binding protein [Hufsiella ginkgonis]MXV17835.1 ABC transporter substrate-binding protein [Hufsiella ginkgonis]
MHRLPGLLFISALFFAGCSAPSPDSRKVFNINLEQGLTSLDPAFARNQFAIWMDNQLYNGLVQVDDDLKTVPAIAKSWELSPDGKRYTFHLRKDVYFHDDPLFRNGKGRRVTGPDFVYSFGRIIDPLVASSGGWIFNGKVSGKEAFAAPNDSTFIVNLRNPFPPFLSMLTAQYCSVVPHEVADHYGKDLRSHPVGTGPFKFKYWKEGEILVLLKNENYWEKDKNGNRLPYLDAVKASFISDKQTAFMEFLKNNLDFFNSLDGSFRDDLLTKSGRPTKKYAGKFRMITNPFLNTEYLGMLVDTSFSIVKNSPLKDIRIRKAINYAIDKKKLVKYLRNSIGSPGHSGFVPKGMPGFNADSVSGYSYNPEKARELLAAAGYPNGKNMPPVLLQTSTTYKDLIEFVQGELAAIGINCRVEVNQTSSLRDLIAKNSVNFFRGSWIADYPDAENYLSVFYSKNYVPVGPNYTSFKNKQFDALFEKAYFVTNDEERFRLYRKMDNIVMDQAPVVVLFYDQLFNLYQNNISGYSVNAENLLILKRIKKK